MAQIILEIKNCTGCPFFERKRMYTADSWEEAYDWFCKKENGKKIQGYVEWNEADKIKVPDWCPIVRAKKLKAVPNGR